jgi:hypothetical protein
MAADRETWLSFNAGRLQQTGYTTPLSGLPFNHGTVQQVVGHFLARPSFNSHVYRLSDREPRTLQEHVERGAIVACWTLKDAIEAPHLLQTALLLAPVAKAFLGTETPTLYSMNSFVTFPRGGVKPDIQEFHRDPDDTRFVTVFFYLTDIGADSAQEIVTRDVEAEVTIERAGFYAEKLTGPAGSVVMVDTSLMHRGRKPSLRPRMIAWARYGVSEMPAAYAYDGLSPVTAPEILETLNEDERRLCRLILQP